MAQNYLFVRYNTPWGQLRPWGVKSRRMEAPPTRNRAKILFRADDQYANSVDSIAWIFSAISKRRITKARILRALLEVGHKIVEFYGHEMEPELRYELLRYGVTPEFLVCSSRIGEALKKYPNLLISPEKTLH